jgi:hypothetical protein
MKIRAVGAEFHADRRADGRSDMTKLIVAFRNFTNAPIYSQVKCKFSPARTRKTCGYSGGIATFILKVGTRLLASHLGRFNIRERPLVSIK